MRYLKKYLIVIVFLLLLSINIVPVKAERYDYGLMYKRPMNSKEISEQFSRDIYDNFLNSESLWEYLFNGLSITYDAYVAVWELSVPGKDNKTFYWTPINEQENQYTSNDWYPHEYVIDIDSAGHASLMEYSDNNTIYTFYTSTSFENKMNKMFGVRDFSCVNDGTCFFTKPYTTFFSPANGKTNTDLSAIDQYYQKYDTAPETMLVCYEHDSANDRGVLVFYPAVDKMNIDYDKYINRFSMITFTWFEDDEVLFPFNVESKKYNIITGSAAKVVPAFPMCNFVARHPDTKLACAIAEEKKSLIKFAIDKYGCGSSQFNKEYEEFKKYCDTYRKNNNSDQCSDLCDKFRDEYVKMCGEPLPDLKCGSLGTGLIGWLMKILKIIRYIVPVLVIVLSVVDFVQAIGASNDEALKKASGKFIKRIIAAVLIFLLPVILQFLFDIFKIKGLDSNDPFCMK